MPQNELIKKTGTGGLPQSVLLKAQETADNIDLDVMPFAIDKINILKNKIQSDDFMGAQNDNMIDDFLHDLVPLDVTIKLAKNPGLASLSSSLLKFAESLTHVNIDAYNVIRAHIIALDVVISKNINSSLNNPAIKALTAELQDASSRYSTKYGTHN